MWIPQGVQSGILTENLSEIRRRISPGVISGIVSDVSPDIATRLLSGIPAGVPSKTSFLDFPKAFAGFPKNQLWNFSSISYCVSFKSSC